MSNLSERLGVRLRDIRQARGLSQEQLAERAGVSYKFIGDVERGHGNPTVKWLDAVARGLGVTVTDLIVDEPPNLSYPPLTGRDYSLVREARDTLEDLLRRYGDTARRVPAATRPRARKRPNKASR